MEKVGGLTAFLGSSLGKDADEIIPQDDKEARALALTGSKSLKPWDQIVTDEQGRRRFHGAFTGGFSAGYFNTVGSKEGWAPSTFKSSRDNRGERRQQRVEDFMDDEDLASSAIAGKTIIRRSEWQQSKDNRSSAMNVPRGVDETFERARSSDQNLLDLFQPIRLQDSIGKQILRHLGWREGRMLGIGGPQKELLTPLNEEEDSAGIEQSTEQAKNGPVKRILGPTMPPSHMVIDASWKEEDMSDREKIVLKKLESLERARRLLFIPKMDFKGLGYEGVSFSSYPTEWVESVAASGTYELSLRMTSSSLPSACTRREDSRRPILPMSAILNSGASEGGEGESLHPEAYSLVSTGVLDEGGDDEWEDIYGNPSKNKRNYHQYVAAGEDDEDERAAMVVSNHHRAVVENRPSTSPPGDPPSSPGYPQRVCRDGKAPVEGFILSKESYDNRSTSRRSFRPLAIPKWFKGIHQSASSTVEDSSTRPETEVSKRIEHRGRVLGSLASPPSLPPFTAPEESAAQPLWRGVTDDMKQRVLSSLFGNRSNAFVNSNQATEEQERKAKSTTPYEGDVEKQRRFRRFCDALQMKIPASEAYADDAKIGAAVAAKEREEFGRMFAIMKKEGSLDLGTASEGSSHLQRSLGYWRPCHLLCKRMGIHDPWAKKPFPEKETTSSVSSSLAVNGSVSGFDFVSSAGPIPQDDDPSRRRITSPLALDNLPSRPSLSVFKDIFGC